MSERPFDLIIFGVTGCTGAYCLRNMLAMQGEEGKKYRFAVAGRNRLKIKVILDRVGKEVERDLAQEIPIIEADVNNVESLTAMTGQCRVLVNVVGPYIQYGLPVIEACIQVCLCSNLTQLAITIKHRFNPSSSCADRNASCRLVGRTAISGIDPSRFAR
jgi:short subunit dehydrogenase-like uncharacterized protein